VPAAGAHATVTGAVPPVAVGVPYVTATGTPPSDDVSTEAGHETVSCGGGGGGGATGDPPQLVEQTSTAAVQPRAQRYAQSDDQKTTGGTRNYSRGSPCASTDPALIFQVPSPTIQEFPAVSIARPRPRATTLL